MAVSILLVEHEGFWRGQDATALSESGYVVTEISSYDPADVAKAIEEIDLVIVSGTTFAIVQPLCQWLAENKKLFLASVLILESKDMRTLFLMGAADVIVLHPAGEVLSQAVAELLERQNKSGYHRFVREN